MSRSANRRSSGKQVSMHEQRHVLQPQHLPKWNVSIEWQVIFTKNVLSSGRHATNPQRVNTTEGPIARSVHSQEARRSAQTMKNCAFQNLSSVFPLILWKGQSTNFSRLNLISTIMRQLSINCLAFLWFHWKHKDSWRADGKQSPSSWLTAIGTIQSWGQVDSGCWFKYH